MRLLQFLAVIAAFSGCDCCIFWLLHLWVLSCVCVHRLAVGDNYDGALELSVEDTDDDMPALDQSL